MMKSNFLNLPSSAAGDARRHVPFRSIINKHFSILFVLVFVFSIMFSYRTSVFALAAPELNPVYNTDIIQIEEYVNGLSSGQMDVFNTLLGFYLASQAGAAKYQIEDPYVDQSGVLNWLKSCGVKFYNDFAGWLGGYDALVGIDKDKMLSIIMGAAILADQYQDQSDFVSDISNSNNYFLPFDKSLQIGLNQFLASNGGLYNWQFDNGVFISNFSWRTSNASQVLKNEIFNWVSQGNLPFVQCNNNYSIYCTDGLFSSGLDTLSIYHILFINTESHRLYLVDEYGNVFNGVKDPYYAYLESNQLCRFTGNPSMFEYNYYDVYNPANYNNYKSIAQDFFDSVFISNDVNWSQFVNRVYYGTDWNSKVEIFNNTDLNISQYDPVSYDQVQTDLLLDIKGLLQDLLDTNELKEPVFNNFYDTSGQPVSDPATVNVSVNAVLPESGIDIPNNLFSPLTKEGGYISYLWYMTKPLVQYTSDFVQTLVFPDDTGEGFDVTGPGAIVFGVISLGLIGGLVVKCLL